MFRNHFYAVPWQRFPESIDDQDDTFTEAAERGRKQDDCLVVYPECSFNLFALEGE